MQPRRITVQAMPPIELWQFIARFAQSMSLLKDALDFLVRIAPVALAAAGLYMWNYLHTIGWSSLFFDSAMSVPGLLFLVLAAVLFSFLAMVLTLLPSIAMVYFTHLFYGADRMLPKDVLPMFGWPLLAWLGIFSLFSFLPDSTEWYALFVVLLAALLLGVGRANDLRRVPGPSAWSWRLAGRIVGLSVASSAAVLMTFVPLLLPFKVVTEFGQLRRWEEGLLFGACLAIACFGTLPGFVYLRKWTRVRGSREPLKMAFAGALMVAMVLLYLALFLTPVRSVFLKGVGVYSNEVARYQVLDNKLFLALKAAGLKTDAGDGSQWVTAYTRYNFGATKLLCHAPFEAARVATHDREKARKGKSVSPEIRAGYQCVPAKAGEVREFKGAEPPPLP